MSIHCIHTPEESEVEEVLKKLVNGKAAGLDDLPTRLLKENSKEFAVPLAMIIRKIIESSCYPSTYKSTLLFPVHKAGATNSILNFRPISILSSINKVIEKILWNSSLGSSRCARVTFNYLRIKLKILKKNVKTRKCES